MDPFHAKVIAATLGSTLTAFTMTPFDVVKTRLQTQPPQQQMLFPRPPPNTCCQPGHALCIRNMSSYARSLAGAGEELVCVWDHGVFKTQRVNGFVDAVKHVWRAEGLRGLWKGTGTTLLIGVPSSTCYMLTYDHLLNVTFPSLIPSPAAVPLVAGIVARTTIATVASPLELIRTNLQSTPPSPSNPHTLRSVLASVRARVRGEGILCMWKGLAPTLWRDVPFSGIYWASYEGWKQVFARRYKEGFWVTFVSGAISGTTAAFLVSPFDVLKTRRQAFIMSASSSGVSRTGPLLAQIVKTEGVSALFAGLLPRVAKIAPACGIMIACFEGVGKSLARN